MSVDMLAATGLNILSGLARKEPKPDYTSLKNGVQWRVADAKAAGIHPLFAMGANISSPTMTAGDNSTSDALEAAGAGIANMSSQRLQKQQIANQTTESQARTKLLMSQAAESDFALFSAKQSYRSQLRNSMNSSNDVPFLEPVGTQATQNLTLGADIQNWEDKWGDAAAVMAVPKLGYEMTGKRYPTKWLNKMIDDQARRKYPAVNFTYKNGKKVYDR